MKLLSAMLFAALASCQTKPANKTAVNTEATKPHQLSFDELQMCARDLSFYRMPKSELEPPKPSAPKHTTVEGLRIGETAYTVALDSWNGKIYVLGVLDAYWQPTTYDGTRFNVAIRRSKTGILADCSGTPFVVIDDDELSSGYLMVVGQFNLEEEQRK